MIRKIAMGIVVAIFLLAAALPALAGGPAKAISNNPEAQKLIDETWALEIPDHSAEIFKQCVSLMEQAAQLDPDNHAILSDLSRYYWSYGDNLPKQTLEQQKFLEDIYAKGLNAADKSLKVKQTPAGHYWYTVNKAASLEFRSILVQVAALPTLYRHYRYVADNDPDYFYGATGRLYTEILSRVPKKLVEIVGQTHLSEAKRQINRAIRKEPRYLSNYIYKARFMYVYFGNQDEALQLLDTALKMEPNDLPDAATDNRVSQREARQLWKKITGKEYPQRQ